MGVEGSYNFHRVSATATTSGVVSAERLGRLGSEGYDTVINLLPDSSEYAIAGEADIVGEHGLNYVYIPVDFAAPTGADLGAFFDAHRSPPRMTRCRGIGPAIGPRTPRLWRRLGVAQPGPSVDRDAARSWMTLEGCTDGT